MIWSLGESSSKAIRASIAPTEPSEVCEGEGEGKGNVWAEDFCVHIRISSASRPDLAQNHQPKTLFCGSGASSSASAPLPAPCEPPPDKASCCVDCAQELSGVNASPLATYCSKCFFFHVSLNNRGLKQPISGAIHCILCSEQITQDSKSPVAGCCFMCWESQETIAAAMQAEAKDRNMTAECDVATAERPCVD